MADDGIDAGYGRQSAHSATVAGEKQIFRYDPTQTHHRNLEMLKALTQFFSRKVSTVQPLIYNMFSSQTRGVYPPRNLAQYADDAYKRNVVAYKSINTVAKGVAYLPLEVKLGDNDAPQNHPLVKLLKRPNPWTSKQQLFEAYAAYLLMTGNTYLEGVGPEGGAPNELWNLRPDRMRVKPGRFGVDGYIYEVNGQTKQWAVDPITGASPVLHVKTFNPLSDWYGMSPVEAAAYSIDGHNEAGEWNQALLQNSARPSGALVYKSTDGSVLSDKQFGRLKEEINSAMAGGRNAGRVPIFDGGLEWQQMSMSPAEMDWLNGKNNAAREIALAFGVPPQMLGIPGDNTYSNYSEARASLYEDTILPLANCLVDSLNTWLAPSFGENCYISIDIDDIPAFAEKRQKRWESVQSADWLTINEKREATGFEPISAPEADEIFLPSGMMPLKGSTEVPDMSESDKPEVEQEAEQDDSNEGDVQQEQDEEKP